MEPFFIDDQYYHDYEYLIDELFDEYNVDKVEDLPDDLEIEAHKTENRPIIQFSADRLAQMAEDEYSEENEDEEYNRIVSALNECVDFEKLNSMIPRLNYWTRQKFTITKKDLI